MRFSSPGFICGRETRLAIKQIGIPRQLNQLLDIIGAKEGVNNVRNLLSSGRHDERIAPFLQCQRLALSVPCAALEKRCRGHALAQRFFYCVQPRTALQAHAVQSVRPDIEPAFFLQAEVQARDAMIQDRRVERERWFINKRPAKGTVADHLGLEALGGGEAHALSLRPPNLMNREHHGIIPDQVPGVTRKLPLHVGNDAVGTKKVYWILAIERTTKPVIKTIKVIDVSMGDKNMGDFEHLTGAEGRNVPEIKQERSSLIAKRYVQTRIVKRVVD